MESTSAPALWGSLCRPAFLCVTPTAARGPCSSSPSGRSGRRWGWRRRPKSLRDELFQIESGYDGFAGGDRRLKRRFLRFTVALVEAIRAVDHLAVDFLFVAPVQRDDVIARLGAIVCPERRELIGPVFLHHGEGGRTFFIVDRVKMDQGAGGGLPPEKNLTRDRVDLILGCRVAC